MSVTVSGTSGLTNAYTSVLSATGSLEIWGASRWDDMTYLGSFWICRCWEWWERSVVVL